MQSSLFRRSILSMNDEPKAQRKWDFDRVFRHLLTIGTVTIVLLLLHHLRDVLIPFAVALLLAYLLNPIVNALESRIKRRGVAVFITVLGSAIVAFSLTLVVIFIGGKEIASLRGLAQEFAHTPTADDVKGVGIALDEFIDNQQNETVKTYLLEIKKQLQENAEEYRDSLQPVALVRKTVKLIIPSVVGFVSGAASFLLGLTGLVVILLYLVFLLMDYPIIAKTWRGFLPPTYREDILGFIDEFGLAMSRYFRGQFIIAMTVGVLFAIGFSLIGLRMAVLLGLCIGLLNMVPYLQTVGVIPALILGLVRGLESAGSIWTAPILVLLVFVVVQTIQDAVLTPSIMGKTVGLRPVVLLLGIFIWGKLLGFLGLVLAIPLTCLGLAYYKRFVLGDLQAKAIQNE